MKVVLDINFQTEVKIIIDLLLAPKPSDMRCSIEFVSKLTSCAVILFSGFFALAIKSPASHTEEFLHCVFSDCIQTGISVNIVLKCGTERTEWRAVGV